MVLLILVYDKVVQKQIYKIRYIEHWDGIFVTTLSIGSLNFLKL